MNNGWIKLHRKSLESSIWTNPFVWMVWCWILLKASHEPQRFPFNGKDTEIRPGQFITGRDRACVEIPTSTPQKLRTALKYLKSTSRITIKSTNQFSLISVVKWSDYQNGNQQNNQQPNQRITNEQPTDNQRITTYKKDKNVKNEKKEIGEQARKVFPRESYDQVTEAYKAIKGVQPQGKEWLPIQRDIKLMFESGRTPEQIIEAMHVCREKYDDWTMTTVRMKIADISAGQLQGILKPIINKRIFT